MLKEKKHCGKKKNTHEGHFYDYCGGLHLILISEILALNQPKVGRFLSLSSRIYTLLMETHIALGLLSFKKKIHYKMLAYTEPVIIKVT